MLLSVSQLSHSFGANTILLDVSCGLNPGEHVGLVGSNGSGKTTLLRIFAGEFSPDAGSVISLSGLRTGYLPQHPPKVSSDTTIEDLIYASTGDIRQIERRLRQLERAMADPSADSDLVFQEYELLQAQFDDRGGYDIDYRIDTVLAGLAIGYIPRTQPVVTLSGGESGRLHLAMILLQSPDILLLDEPTNHLDFAGAEWLSNFLSDYRGAVLAVSHDRTFLNDAVTRILEIDEHSHTIKEYSGNYDFYRETKQREQADWSERYVSQQREIKELKRLIKVRSASRSAKIPPPPDPDKSLYNAQGARADATAAKDIRWFRERLRRLEEHPIPKPPAPLRISPSFRGQELRSSEIFRLEGVSKCYGGIWVLRDIDFVFSRGSRITIVGPNGSGKSTLLNIIAGLLEPDAGTMTAAPGVRIGYLDQDAALLNPDHTLIDAYRRDLVGYEHHLISDLLKHGLFRYEDLTTLVRELSLGQKRKLQIARFVAEEVNVLLLDEPTNYLSLDVLEDFERALAEFPGPILAVSHDRWFIERFAGQIWTIENGSISEQFGDPKNVVAALTEASKRVAEKWRAEIK